MSAENQKYDKDRTDFINSQKIKVIRFWDNGIFNNLTGVIEKIIVELKSTD